MDPYRNYGSKTRHAAARWMTWLVLGAGVVMLLISLMRPSRDVIPGWQPVNHALESTLAAHRSPGDAADPRKDALASSPPPTAAAATTGPASTPPSTAAATSGSSAPAREQGAASASPPGLLDLNAATEAEFDGLPGIGPAKAKAIAAYRQAHGSFRSVEDLLEVKGIGPKLLEQIRPVVSVSNTRKSP